MSTRLLLTTLVSSTLASFAWAQSPLPVDTGAPADPVASVEGAAPTQSSVSRDRDTLSVDFPDEEIRTILRNVADLFELNLVVPETLTGKTSIKLRDVTWRQIFQVVLSPVGYTYVEDGNIIKIVSNESLLQEPTTTEVVIVNNAKASDILPTIQVLVDAAAGGKIVVDARSNALVITERPSRMGRIRETIDKLDKATEQVMIETKFVEVTDRDIRNIGVNWASLQGFQVGVGGITQTFDRARGQTFSSGVDSSNSTGTNQTSGTSNSNSTTTTSGSSNSTNNGTTGSTSNSNNSTNTVGFNVNPTGLNLSNGSFGSATLNLPSGNVTDLPASVPGNLTVSGFTPATTTGTTTTPASFTSPVSNTTTISNGSTSGTTSSTSNGTTSGTNNSITDTITNSVTNTASNTLSNLMGLANSGSTNRLASAVFSASEFNLVLSALKTQNNTKIVSNPTVVTLNNSEAFLNIGQEFPIPNYTYNSERGTFEVSGFTYKPIGIIMKVTPQVNAQGIIKLTVEPEVSQRQGETSFGGAGGAQIPIIATRKARTMVSLQNGFTMGIGGLITSLKSHGGTKVPLLGDIPGLGKLFSSKNVNDEITNLLIFLTARTVSAEGITPEELFNKSAIEAVGLTPEEMRGYGAPPK